MPTFLCHPAGGGSNPAIVFYMDAPGIREELRDMARRLAAAGYFVLLPNLYYRSGVAELGPIPSAIDDPRRRRMVELMNALTIDMVMDDTLSLIAFVDSQPAARRGAMGCVGYCMSGQFAVNAAARFPHRFSAAASIYGTLLVTDRSDSPHLAARNTDTEFYFGCAEKDRWAPLTMVERLATELRAAMVNAEVEIYPGVEHGFAFPQRAAYNRTAAERHWERLFALFARRLKVE